MKKFILLLLTAVLLLGATPAVFAADDASRFWDVSTSSWAHTYIMKMADNGIIIGHEDGSFRPDDNVTRAEWAKMMMLAAGAYIGDYSVQFADMVGHWANAYVNAAKDYLTPYEDGNYNPDANALREDVTVSMVKLKGYNTNGATGQSVSFWDIDTTSENSKYISIAVENGLINGYPDGTFHGSESLTRAEAATILCRAFLGDAIDTENKTPDPTPEPQPEVNYDFLTEDIYEIQDIPDYIDYDDVLRWSLTDEQYNRVDRKSNEIIDKIIYDDMTDLEKVAAVHDYVVLNCAYDYENYINDTIPELSYTAYGVLINNIAVCDGYTRAMMLILNKLDIETKRICNGRHAWNIVKLNGDWYHLDATWDDPDRNEMSDWIEYDYFCISDSQLKENDTESHFWDKSEYPACDNSKGPLLMKMPNVTELYNTGRIAINPSETVATFDIDKYFSKRFFNNYWYHFNLNIKEEPTDTAEKGKAYKQTPQSGTNIYLHDITKGELYVNISSAAQDIPDISGMQVQEAIRRLSDSGVTSQNTGFDVRYSLTTEEDKHNQVYAFQKMDSNGQNFKSWMLDCYYYPSKELTDITSSIDSITEQKIKEESPLSAADLIRLEREINVKLTEIVNYASVEIEGKYVRCINEPVEKMVVQAYTGDVAVKNFSGKGKLRGYTIGDFTVDPSNKNTLVLDIRLTLEPLSETDGEETPEQSENSEDESPIENEEEISMESLKDSYDLVFQAGSKQYCANHEVRYVTSPILLENGELFISLRTLAESLNYSVDWDESTQTMTLKNGQDELVMTMEKSTVYFNKVATTLSSPVTGKEYGTYLPAADILTAIGYDVTYNSDNWLLTATRAKSN